MEKQEQDKISAFDSLYTTNHIQMMKIILPYFPSALQGQMAVYIKYLEFQYALSCQESHSHGWQGCTSCSSDKSLSINDIFMEILPFCTKEEKHQLEQLSGWMHSMEMYREISTSMEVFKQLSPDIFSQFSSPPLAGEPTNPMDSASLTNLLMNLLSPEQKSMFEMFGGNDTHDAK